MQHERVREILRDAVDVTKEVPSELRSIAFTKVFELLTNGGSIREEDSSASKSPERSKKKEPLGKGVRRPRNGLGPKQVVIQSLENSFFDQPKTIESLAQHLKQDFALTFVSARLATALARLVRDGQLRRKQNQEGRYEYQKI
jgi:hypothetical protein